MTVSRVGPGLLGLLLAAAFTTATGVAQRLTDTTWEAIRDRVLPTAADLAWSAIPWHSTLASAALAAEASDRPILLWVMNGHPLGAT